MFCRNCGNQIPDGVKFCTKCGKPVSGKKTSEIQYQQRKPESQREQRPVSRPDRSRKPERNPQPEWDSQEQWEPRLNRAPKRKKVNPGLIILIVLLVVLVVGATGAAIWYAGGGDMVKGLSKQEETTESAEESLEEETEESEAKTAETTKEAEPSTEGMAQTTAAAESESGEYFVGRKISEGETRSYYQNSYQSTTAAAPTTAAEDVPESTDGMVFPDSDRRYLSESDLSGLSAEWLRIARNEIYARHGRLFTDTGLQNYFNQCSWYYGSIPGNKFQESSLNAYELYNRNLIVDYEKKMGYSS